MNTEENKLKEKLRLVGEEDVVLEGNEAEIYNIHTSDILSIEELTIESGGKDGN